MCEIASKISELVDEISESSQEQAHGIEQVNKAITQMDEMRVRCGDREAKTCRGQSYSFLHTIEIGQCARNLVFSWSYDCSAFRRRRADGDQCQRKADVGPVERVGRSAQGRFQHVL